MSCAQSSTVAGSISPRLVILGSRAKARQLPDDGDKARKASKVLAEWIRSGTGPKLDLAAAEEVKYLGLIANYDE